VEETPPEAWPAAASALATRAGAGIASPPVGFRVNAAPRVRITIANETRSVDVPAVRTSAPWAPASDGSVVLDLRGRSARAVLAAPPTVEAAVRGAAHDGPSAASIAAPMPGTVIAVRVNDGDLVDAGQVLIVLEAMKMENTVPAPAAGRVARVLVAPGQQVQRAEILVELE